MRLLGESLPRPVVHRIAALPICRLSSVVCRSFPSHLASFPFRTSVSDLSSLYPFNITAFVSSAVVASRRKMT